MIIMYLLPFLNFSGSGIYGVYLFFVLSAFLLSLQFFDRYRNNLRDPRIWFNYALRRFFRIFPLYTVVLLVNHIFSKTGNFLPLSRSDVWTHLTLRDGRFLLWTIPVEFKYYMALPLVVILFLVILKGRIGFITITVLLFVYITEPSLWTTPGEKFSQISLIRCFPVFVLGSLSSFAYWKLREKGGVKSKRAKLTLEITATICFIIVILFIPALCKSIFGHPLIVGYNRIKIFGVLWSVFIISYMNGVGIINRVLSIAPLRFIGIISFSIYLWHIPAILFVSKNVSLPSTINAILVFLITIFLSTVSYMFIERPFLKIRLKKKTMRGNYAAV